MPGRSRSTQTRSAPGQTAQVTGVDIVTASPSTPTGICAASAVISTFFVVSSLTLPVAARQCPEDVYEPAAVAGLKKLDTSQARWLLYEARANGAVG